MPNPNGVNQFDRFSGSNAYGEVQRQKKLTQAAPLAENPALNAPRRLQKQAVRGSRLPQQPAGVSVPLPPPPSSDVRPEVLAAETWQALLASDPMFDDPLVRYFADEAARKAGK